MLAPAVAACGGFVPMISGRGLGHTGGTLDKLDAIPGYSTQPDIELFRSVVREVGCAIIGQTARPRARRPPSLRDPRRDRDGRVDPAHHRPRSSSKKLAAGLDGLVMDVKSGNGAFMPTDDEARMLAESLVAIANGAGVETAALITDMKPSRSAPPPAMPWSRNAIDFLAGRDRDPRLEADDGARPSSSAFPAWPPMKATPQEDRGRLHRCRREIFGRDGRRLGGPADFVEDPDAHLVGGDVAEGG